MVIKAIETHYGGYHFRSRLEARWAVFFDTLGVKYEYEPEGFDLGVAGWYLPDFWLPEVKMWVEVKPKPLNSVELDKCRVLSRTTKHDCLLLIGTPDNKAYHTIDEMFEPEYYYEGWCLTKEYIDEGRFWFLDAGDADDDYVFKDTQNAVIAAKSARFEHASR